MAQGYGPGGYGPPQGYGQGQPPYQQGYGPPPGPPRKQGMSTLAKVLIVLLVIGVCSIGGCLVCVGIGANAVKQADDQKHEDMKSATKVQIGHLLTDYKSNEVKADQTYKGKAVQTTGKVDSISKALGSTYITLGSGVAFEIPKVQCMLDSTQEAKAARLSKGQQATVKGIVTGLSFNVMMNPCEIQ